MAEEHEAVEEIIASENRRFVAFTVWGGLPFHNAIWMHGHIKIRSNYTWWSRRKHRWLTIWGLGMEEAFPYGIPF